MDDEKLFSQHYSSDTNRYMDKEKFRGRILKYLEFLVNDVGYACQSKVYHNCGTEMGIDINRVIAGAYFVEETFRKKPIDDILDFITIVYDTLSSDLIYQSKLKTYIKDINRIFQEESMCYALHDNGRVRYYPDDESRKLTKSTLSVLNKPKYSNHLNAFNNVLDDIYKNRDSEPPIRKLFNCVETFVLSIIDNKKYKQLKEDSIDKLMQIFKNKIDQKTEYTEDDKEILQNINNIFLKWVGSCHPHRHGKKDQKNENVPTELFNFIISTGISIFRLLLEMDDKYLNPPELT